MSKRLLIFLPLVGALLMGAACKTSSKKPPVEPEQTEVVTTPVTTPVGRVAHVNSRLRYAVIEFSPGNIPQADQRMSIYRDGMKVGELRITGPTRGANTTGDILSGTAQENDTVRVD